MNSNKIHDEVIIRMAKRDDCAAIRDLKLELAEHHNISVSPKLSVEEFQRDGFDIDPPCYHCIVAEIPAGESELKIVGYALYFYVYSVWAGKALELKDIIVSAKFRGKGIGTKLMKQLAKIALDEDCVRIQLGVHQKNASALKFYDNHGGWNSTKVLGWHNYEFDIEAIKKWH